MNIKALASEIWGTDNWTPEQMARLERFREAVVQELVAGSGEPAIHMIVDATGTVAPYFTRDQLAGAVLRYKADAERYRWIRDHDAMHDTKGLIYRAQSDKAQIDAEIDAAIRSGE